ncbi:MAG: hypothetical protein M0011_07590 [Elusimicrobia bacterium]|nr:hypothetical protein [Elusimicrobiota bacterium]
MRLRNMLNKTVFALLAALFRAASASAADFDNFKYASARTMKPFARDLGGLLGSGTNQTARPLGFSGFDIGIRAVTQFNPSSGNTVLRRDNLFGLGFVQAEIGMPYRIDGFVRAGVVEGLTVAGGGLRYGLWNVSDEKGKFNAMLIGMGNMAASRYFYAVHFNASAVCSLNVPVVSPFIGAGYDFTRLNAQGVADTALDGKQVRTAEPRVSAGFRVKMHLGYLSVSVTQTHGRSLLGASAGFRF